MVEGPILLAVEDEEGPAPLHVGFLVRPGGLGNKKPVELRLGPEVCALLRRRARALGVPPKTLYFAAWALVLSRYTDRAAVRFGRDGGPPIEAQIRDQALEPWLKSLADGAAEPADSALGNHDTAMVFDDEPIPASLSLVIRVEVDKELVLLHFLSAAARLDRPTVERIALHYRTALVSLLSSADDTPVEQLQILTQPERARLIYAVNRTEGAYPDDQLLHTLFEQRATTQPNALALRCEEHSLSYAQLNAAANRMARYLLEQGVSAGDLVAVCLERSCELVVSMLAILKARCAYVPLDPSYPQTRLRWMLQDSGAKMVITSAKLRSRVEPLRAMVLEEVRASVEAMDATDLRSERTADPDALAYIIYTSGSSGTPKGVAVRHRAAVNLVDWVNQRFEVVPDDQLLFVTSVCFDLSVYDIFGTLAAGASIRIASGRELEDPARLLNILNSEPITFWDSAPAAMMQLAPLFSAAQSQQKLRLIFLSGDWVPVSLPDQLRSVFNRAKLVVLGGATEATVWSNYFEVGSVDPQWPSIPYGRPIRNARYYILDRRLRPAPIGVPGDLYIAGLCLAEHYHNQPGLTASRFLPDPYAQQERMYKTGDRARFMPDGAIEFLGRRDRQFKIRGFRVELGEVEAALSNHPSVSLAIADAPLGFDGVRRLVAYVVPQGQSAEPEALSAYLKERLPPHMLPAIIQQIDSVPLTHNGKLDRTALPAAAVSVSDAPTDPLESELSGMFAEILGLEMVGAQDSFFQLGGHSLMAASLLVKINERYGSCVPLPALVRTPTPQGAAQLLRSKRWSEPEPLIRAEEGPAQLTHAQLRMLFIQQLEPNSAVYNVPVLFQIQGEVDASMLREALQVVVARHEPLRTGVRIERGAPRAVVTEAPLELVEEPLSEVGQLRVVVTELAERKFEFNGAPMLRARLYRLPGGRFALALVVHHAMLDARSIELIQTELVQIYDALHRGVAHALAPLPISYSDYARFERAAPSKGLQPAIEPPLPVLALPVDRARPAVFSYRGSVRFWTADEELTRSINQLARVRGVTRFAILLTAYQLWLHRFCRQRDVLVGVPVSGRHHPQTRDMVGLFLDTAVMRSRYESQRSFIEMLESQRVMVSEALEHAQVPLTEILERFRIPRDPSRTPIVQTFFSLEEQDRASVRGEKLALRLAPVEHRFSRADLSLFLTQNPKALGGYFEYATDLFDADTIARMVEGFEALLRHVVRYASAPVSRAPIVSEATRTQLLFGFNRTKEVLQPITVVDRIEAQAKLSAPRIAMRHGARTLTYEALQNWVNAIAAQLGEVDEGQGVVVLMERGPRLVATLLAVLKRGAYYIPIDPEHHERRNRQILDEARPDWILVDEAGQGLSIAQDAKAKTLCIHEPRDEDPVSTEPSRARESHLAYAIFTSGSTGRPKGVKITHRSLNNFLHSMSRTPGLSQQDRMLALTTIAFDISALELYLPLVTGAEVQLATAAQAKDPQRLMALMRSFLPTVLQATPSTYKMLLASGWQPQNMRLLCGGEALPAELGRSLAAKAVEVFNLYGPTETTIWSSVARVQVEAKEVTIGAPIANTRMYVLDEALLPVPVGVTGELYIAGEGVAQGYLHRPELERAFLPDPFVEGERMYRTGDLARRRGDGELVCLGRTDHQIKVRGHRVELGEIEGVLQKHPEVHSAAVRAQLGPDSTPQLVGYLVCKDEVPPDLRAHVRRLLPAHMCPAAYQLLSKLPLNTNGKIDRGALPELTVRSAWESSRTNARRRPRDDIELQIVRLMEKLLGVSGLSIDDDFFELGGHSLLAAQLLASIKEAFGCELSLATLFATPTVNGLGQAVRLGGGALRSEVFLLSEGENQAPLYCICGIHLYQELAEQIGEARSSYGIFVPQEQQILGLQSGGTPSVERLAEAYTQAICAHRVSGPVALAGYSFGGVLAFEIARQLQVLGRDVELVTLLDPVLPGGLRRRVRQWVAHRALRLAQRLPKVWTAEETVPRAIEQRDEALVHIDQKRLEIYRIATNAYDQSVHGYRGRVLLIRASDQSDLVGFEVAPDLGWSRHAHGRIEIHKVLGAHRSVLQQPALTQVARLMRERMAPLSPKSSFSREARAPASPRP